MPKQINVFSIMFWCNVFIFFFTQMKKYSSDTLKKLHTVAFNPHQKGKLAWQIWHISISMLLFLSSMEINHFEIAFFFLSSRSAVENSRLGENPDPTRHLCPKNVLNEKFISLLSGRLAAQKSKSARLPLPHLALLSLTICYSASSLSVSRVLLLLLLVSFQIRGNPSNSCASF